MKRYLAFMAVAASFLVLVSPGLLTAQKGQQQPQPAAPAVQPTAPAEDTDYTYGIVSSVGTDQIVIKEYDYDKDVEVETTYLVATDTKIENAASLKEIAKGDSVEIDYIAKDDKKMAKIITVEKPLAEEATPGAGDLGPDEEETGPTSTVEPATVPPTK
jgi:hypothetical protein